MLEPQPNDPNTESKKHVEKPLDVLLRLASSARICRSSDGRLHARVAVEGRYETYALKSAGLRNWLTDAFFTACGQPPSLWAIQRVISVLEARAWFDRRMPTVSVRVASVPDPDDSAFYLDLADSTGRAVRISSEGWVVVDAPEVQFRRLHVLLPLPEPTPDGSVDLLRPFVNVTDTDFQLLVTWITAALRPVGPCPILVLHGEPSSGKSTLGKILRLLIDPQTCPLLELPKNTSNLMVTALNGWLLVYDNVSFINRDLSDGLCRLVTGGGISTRTLYSNDERSVIYAQRPVMLNGVEDFVVRGDLVDRCIFLYLRTIPPPSRRDEEGFWRQFHAARPQILGGILNAMACGLRERPAVRLPELPHMADYALWGEAVGRGLGWEPGAFFANYATNRQHATEPAISSSLLATVLKRLGPRLQAPQWQGISPTALFIQLTKHGERVHAAEFPPPRDEAELRKLQRSFAARWPKDAQMFAKELRKIAPQLRLHGLSIDFERDGRGRRVAFKHVLPLRETRRDD